jgi:iron complex transport system ATP-binding protein
VFLSLHDLSLASSLDLLAVLSSTHLRAIGSPAEILTPELLLEVFGVRASEAPGLNFELP